jgi:Serine aminopeptidase, S33
VGGDLIIDLTRVASPEVKLPGLTGTGRDRWLWAGLGTAGALAASGVLEATHVRRIARDPEKDALEHTPKGRAHGVRSADGTILHVEVFGREDGETVVLAHGWTEALRFWTYVIRGLEDAGMRVVAYDLRGHGDSEPARDGDYAIPRSTGRSPYTGSSAARRRCRISRRQSPPPPSGTSRSARTPPPPRWRSSSGCS